MDLRKTVADILGGSADKRIDEVTRILNDGGVGTADDLKYFDWNSLEELGGLSKMEISKIMRYVQENFPDEYGEHKRKRNEERKLKNETEILKCNTVHERKLQEMKIRFEEEKEARVKEQRELEEEFTRSRQDQQNSSKKTGTTSEGASHGFFEQVKQLKGIQLPFGKKDLKQEIAKILKISDPTRVEEISNALQKDGLKVVDELRFYDWKSLETLGVLSTEEINEIMEVIKGEFPETYERHKRRRDNETQKMEELSKYKNIAQEQLKTRDEKMNIEEVIPKIFDGCSNAVRIGKIKEILCYNGLKRAEELSHFDWKSLEDFGLTSAEANRILDFVKDNFPKDYKRHEKRRDEENRMKEELSKYKTDESRQQKPSKLDEMMNIEEVIHKIFDGCSSVTRIGKIKEILCYNGLKRADDLSHFDWKSLEDLGLTSAEANRILDFVKDNFPKDYKRHLKRRDEENRMKEELSKYKTGINKSQVPSKLGIDEDAQITSMNSDTLKSEPLSSFMKNDDVNMLAELKKVEMKLQQMEITEIEKIVEFLEKVKQNRERKTKAVEMQGKQSSSQAEATELQQKKDELSRNKSEVQVKTTEIQLQEKVKKSQDFQGRDLNDPQEGLQKSISDNHKSKDQFKDSISNTSNDRQQKSDDTQLSEQPHRHAEAIVKKDKLANSSNNINTSKDKSKKKDGSNQYFNLTKSSPV